MHARQRLAIVRAQPGVGPITALSVATRIAKQRLDLIDPLPIPARRWRRRGAFHRCNTFEALARLEGSVLQLDIAPIAGWIVAQEFIGARDGRAVLVQTRRLHRRCGPAVALFRGPAAVCGELRKCIGKLRLVGRRPHVVAIPTEGVDKLRKRQAGALETVAKGAAKYFVLFAHQSEFAIAVHGGSLRLHDAGAIWKKIFFALRFVAEVWRICPAVEMTASKLDVTLAGVVGSSANSTTSPSTAAGNATLPTPLLPSASWEMTGPRLEPTSWLSTMSPDEALKLPSPTSPRRRP